jgi:hypothetical protein
MRVTALPILLFENDRVRISDVRLKPGESIPVSITKPTVRWQVNDGRHEQISQNGSIGVAECVADKKVFFEEPAVVEDFEIRNVGDNVYRQVWFELLKPPKRTEEETARVLSNSIYTTNVGTSLLFENQFCRCWDFYLDPGQGDSTQPHHHVLDYCFVYVAPGRLLGYSHDGKPGLFDSINEDGDVTWFDIPDGAEKDVNCAHCGKNGYEDHPMREYLVELK